MKSSKSISNPTKQRKSTEERFWAKVNKNGPVHPVLKTRCWIWNNCLLTKYGFIRLKGVQTLAHRLSWIIHFEEIPDKLCICHHCDNPGCVNPKHLFLGTHQNNMEDMYRKGRHAHGDRHKSKVKPESVTRGEAVNTAKLTENQVMKIRRIYREGNISQFKLGVKFNVGQEAISKIVTYKTWKWIKERQ